MMESPLVQNIKNKSLTMKSNKSKLMTCEYCGEEFDLTSEFLEHLKLEHSDEIVMNEEIELKTHSDELIEELFLEMKNRYSCKCGIRFKSFIDLVRHVSKKHLNEFEMMVKGVKDLLMYVINKFDVETIEDSDETGSFVSTEEKEGEYETQFIESHEHSDNFTEENEEISEETIHHTEIRKSGKQKYICQYCGKQLGAARSLKLHFEKLHKFVLDEFDSERTKKRRKYNTLTLSEKQVIINYFDQQMSLKWIHNKTNIPRSTLNSIMRNREKILKHLDKGKHDFKAIRHLKHPDVEKNLYLWYLSEKKENTKFTEKFMQLKAMEIHESLCDISNCSFKVSLGYIKKFRRRYEISLPRKNIQTNTCDSDDIEIEYEYEN